MFFKDRCPNTYEPMLSPLYRLRKIKGEELTEEDDNLVELSKIIGGSEGKAKKIFEDWKSSEPIGWEEVKELFLKA